MSIHEKRSEDCVDSSLISNSFFDDLCMLEAAEIFDKKDKQDKNKLDELKAESLVDSSKKSDFNSTIVSQDVLQNILLYEKNVASSSKKNEHVMNKENHPTPGSKKKLEFHFGDQTLRNILNSSLPSQEQIKSPESLKKSTTVSKLFGNIEKAAEILNIKIKVAQNSEEYELLVSSFKPKQILSMSFVCEKSIDKDSDIFCHRFSTENNKFINFFGIFFCLDTEKQKEVHLMLFKKDKIFLKFLKTILERDDIVKILFFSKDHYKFIRNTFNISIRSPCYDPIIAHWLLNQELTSIFQIKQKYCPNLNLLMDNGLKIVKECYGCNISSKVQTTNIDTIHRGILESLIGVYAFEKIKLQLQLQNLWIYYAKIESEIVFITAEIELTGFGLNTNELDNQKVLLLNKKKEIEEKIFAYNKGKHVNLNSTDEVAFLIYDQLKLKPLIETNKITNEKFKHHSTSKEVLKQMSSQHEIPNLIIMWRKLNHTLSMSLYPIERVSIYTIYLTLEKSLILPVIKI